MPATGRSAMLDRIGATTHEGEPGMANEDGVFLLVGAYASVADAQADYDVVKDLHAEKVVGGFDAAVITKDDNGKVHVNKDETSTRKGAWGGAGVGALVGLLFPPALIGSAAVGAAVGGFGGHLWRGMSRSDLKDLGELLDEGEAGLVVIGDWRLEERIDELLRHAERREAKELRDLDRAETEEQLGALMSGQGS
jgi:uncharacterized membrane protein